ncbi:hypothetical protein MAM1_0001c00061 [Mucor ambiguus]|uniref:Uncharacterized protein n=1 Tax=Mucor ambiguus TaxID=91626 RepID=A0A0C9M3J6_9FUNG|nr:hypothetical protein MAM1_0001c00061 [Mucor ambiguus]
MFSDREVSDNDSLAGLSKAVSLMNTRSNPPRQLYTTAHVSAFDQFNDTLFKSNQLCIDSALEPLVQQMTNVHCELQSANPSSKSAWYHGEGRSTAILEPTSPPSDTASIPKPSGSTAS